MATRWVRAALVSPSVLLRASRSGRVLPKCAPVFSARLASTAASPSLLKPAEDDLVADAADAVEVVEAEENENSDLGKDQPKFESLAGKISRDTLNAITRIFKLETMSPVQAAVLPLLPEIAEPYQPDHEHARDLLVKAKTGTGKTLGFLIPAVEARMKALDAAGKQAVLDAGLKNDKHIELRARRALSRETAGCLILSPTRELATQIANEALRLTSRHDSFEVRLFVGGSSKRMQMRDWMKGRRDIVVSTPGRMRDLLENEPEVAKGMKECKMFILDEADTLLEMGFREDIQAIASYLAPTPERQTFLFSATVSREIQQIARATLDKKHHFIDCVPADASPVHAHIPQYHTILPDASKQIPHILRLLAHDQLLHPGKSKTIIFLPTTRMTQLFSTFLRELTSMCLPAGRQTKVYEIHSKRTMESRSKTSQMFRQDKGPAVLISSDVSARGVDYPGVTRVIQVGIPSTSDQYIHRVGRTGRGKDQIGRADLVLLPWEMGFVTWQLTDITLKPVTVTELASQVKQLCEERNPEKAVILDDMEKEVTSLMSKLEPEAIRETLGAQLGFYMGKTDQLRVQKSVIVEGLKQWTVEACGLAEPPYVSEAFLQKLGFSDGRTKRFGSASRQSYKPSGGPAWTQRGNVQHNRERMAGERRDSERERRSGSFGDRGSSFGDRGSRGSFGDRERGDGSSYRSSYGSRDREGGSFGGRREGGSYGGSREGGSREDRPPRSFGDRSSTRRESF
ncbi:DEAD/DEAH box helicase [Phanerochaete sordida]|uniref:ATP-dependent RNA helicase n=1 Tax=Phanerochaete sordida TaxID=48140 RepID=A0A9P3G0A0_9APHY|nr:DEAD/DEAH box helicase [Phanerochaete sordida]